MYPFNNPLNTQSKKECINILSEYGLPRRKGWWAKYPVRAIVDIQKMACNTSAFLKYKANALIWDEWISTNLGSEFLISIEVKDYPHKMPQVYIKEPKIKSDIDYHMLDDGRLCLMHSDDHNSNNSILVYRNQAAAWCFAYEVYRNTGSWPAAERPH
jgi:hypothetical protein